LFKIGGVANNCLTWSKFCWHVSFLSNLADFFNRLTIGLVLSASFDRKRAMAVNLPTSLCTSLTLLGLHMSMIAWHFSGLASMLHWVSMKPKNLPPLTLKVHFSGLRRRLYFHVALKTLVRFRSCWVGVG